MAVQASVAVRNAKLDAVETTVGTSPTLEIRTGPQPANCAAADAGSLLCSITLPSNWAADAASGAKALAGSWQGTNSGTGAAAHWRLKNGGSCHLQGNVGASGSGADLQLSSVNLVAGGTTTVSSFNMNEANS